MRALLSIAFGAISLSFTSLSAAAVTVSAADRHTTDSHIPWWQHAVIYEIYPRSYQDSNGDGVGDLKGITQRLGYLQDLGIDAIWIAPIYPSPQVDFGYDISDYQAVDLQYGSLADFDALLAEANRRHIRVILDMVLNHTSDQHPWFLEASHSRAAPKHDFYVWNDGRPAAPSRVTGTLHSSDAPPANGSPQLDDTHRPNGFLTPSDTGGRLPPNNWVSLFGGSAWQWVPAVNQFYYHMFYRQQPDLNWRNPQVEQAMFNVMRFWLDRGVAGFRLDAITTLFEDPHLRDDPPLGGRNAQGDPNLSDVYTNNLPEVHDVMRRLRTMTDSYPGDRVLIGETYVPQTRDLDPWYGGSSHNELQLPMDTLFGMGSKLDANTFRQHLAEAQTQLHQSQPLFVFDNHDNIRSWDRYGDGVHNAQIARIIATLLLTSRSAALLYQGEEIGQTTATPTRVQDVRDPIGITGWPKEKGRDGERTPMQWDTSNAEAGFSSNPHTWLPVTPNYVTVNVQAESADPDSLLNWHRHLIALRRTNSALRDGKTLILDETNPNVLSYARLAPDGHAIVVSLNMSVTPQTISLNLHAAGIHGSHLTPLLSNPQGIQSTAAGKLTLPPFAAWIAEVH